MSDLPILEVLPVLGGDERLAALLGALRPIADIRAPDAHLPQPAARIASAPTARRAVAAARDAAVPLGVWIADPADWDAEPTVTEGAAAIITPSPEVADKAGDRAVLIDPQQIELGQLRRVPPFVRARWRRSAGLPADLVITLGLPTSEPLRDDAAHAALGVAAAVAVGSAWALTALALGAPTVLDQATADELDAEDGTHVVVAPPPDAEAAARALAADERLAARLSRSARRLVDSRFDRAAPLARVQSLLHLQADADPAGDLVAERLLELRTPRHGIPFQRAEAALAGLHPPFGLSLHRGAP